MKDLRIPKIQTRKTKGMREFFIFILVYSYYNTEYVDDNNSFILSESLISEYYNKSTRSIIRWFKKLRELGYLQYTKRNDAGETGYYTIKEDGKLVTKSYIKGNNKKKVIRDSKGNLRGCLNVYQLDQRGLNDYLIEHICLNILDNIEKYKYEFDLFMSFIKNRKEKIVEEEINSTKTEEVKNNNESKLSRKDKIRYKKLSKKLVENSVYIEKKKTIEEEHPEFRCKYLDDGCFRLTHELCNTINPQHTDKINENNYWRSSTSRPNMLKNIIHTTNIVEYDVNGSIYRLTYNLYHDKPLDDKIDIYKLIWDNCNFGISWSSTSMRSVFKAILMPIYMKCSTIGYKSRQWEHLDKHINSSNINNMSKVKREFYLLHKQLVDITHMNIKTLLETVRDALFKTLNINKSMGADIFIQESNLHILMREKLLEKGIYSANVYDGFYFNEDDLSEEGFYSIYRDATIELKNNLKLGIGSPIPA